MADEQDASNEDANVPEYDDSSVTNELSVPTSTAALDDYVDDEPLPDVTINLYINDLPGETNTLPADLVNAGLTDIYGNPVTPSTTLADYTSAITEEIYNELNGNGTSIGSKGWFGTWTWTKILFVGLIALCIIAIILALLFLILGKKFKKNKRTTTTTATKSVVAADPRVTGGKYEPVRNV